MSKQIPITTQIPASSYNDMSQQYTEEVMFVSIQCDDETTRQSQLRQQAYNYLVSCLPSFTLLESELEKFKRTSTTLCFVLPSFREATIERIHKHFGTKSISIYMARAIIEHMALGSKLPARSVALNLSLFNCKLFFTDKDMAIQYKNKIYQMCGQVVKSADEANVILVDRANRGCVSKSDKPTVSIKWLDHYWSTAYEDDKEKFHQNARDEADKHLIKPFYNLRLKIEIRDPDKRKMMENLISENQGTVDYNNIQPKKGKRDTKTGTSFIICETFKETQSPRYKTCRAIDCEFVEQCIKKGRFLSFTEYSKEKKPNACQVIDSKKDLIRKVKNETDSQLRTSTNKSTEENRTPPTQDTMVGDAQATDVFMQTSVFHNNTEDLNRPPPTNPCQYKQPGHMNEAILKALAFDTPQTQLPSTQMRRLPDSELRIEQTFEPSQQICWNDCSSRR